MDQQPQPVNTVAPLQNVARCMAAMERVLHRRDHLPGMIAFYGPSGWGKSTAAAYVAAKYRAYHIECKSTWTRNAMLLAILADMGIKPASTIYARADQVAEQLALSGRPLIIDEFDYAVQKGYVELVRDIYESSHAAILLIGEEQLEAGLRRWERFHNRILDWVPAQAAGLDDARHLQHLYCGYLRVTDDLLGVIVEASKGQIRRIVVNLSHIEELASTKGLDTVTLADWGNRPFFTGEAPRRRVS